MNETTFLVQIKRNVNGTFEKGVVVKDTPNAAFQSFHAYLGAYGYGNAAEIDYVACYVISIDGRVLDWKIDDRRPAPQPQPEEVS